MKDKSIWLENIERDKYPTLKDDIKCDILIIGGGITGLTTAYYLRNSHKKIVLVEGNKICCGTTAKSTGKLTYLQGDIIEKIRNIYADDTHLTYLESQKEAIRLAKSIIINNNIKCNLESVNSYIFTNKVLNVSNLKNNFRLIKKNSSIKYKNNLPIKLKCCKVIEANDTFVFHPVKFVIELAKILKDDITIYENTRITGIDENDKYLIAHTKEGDIKARKIVLACHYPFFIIPYFFPFKTGIEKSFLVAATVNKTRPFSAINIDKDVLSMRYYKDKKDYMILVSESSSLLKNIDDIKKSNSVAWKMKSKFSPEVKYSWSNHDIMTTDHLPLIGKIKNNLYLATGYNTWGMTNGILAGKIISDLILEEKSPYQEIFDPLRDEKNIPKRLKFNLENGLSFIDTKIDKNRVFYKKNVKIVTENGRRFGIYIDENGKKHKVLNKCPHMKCNLYFNYQTKTWDCPCHGSSFDIDGKIIYGPSVYDISKR